MKSKYQKIKDLKKNELQLLVNKYRTYKSITISLGYCGESIATKLLKEQIQKTNVDMKTFEKYRYKKNAIWIIDEICLQKLFDESNTYTEVLKKMGYTHGRYYSFLQERVKDSSLDLTQFSKNKNAHKKNCLQPPLVEVLIKDSNYSRRSLKRRLLKLHILKNQCDICKMDNQWMEKELVLQLDHINGDNKDNRIENLRILCPNCHTQTSTYARRNVDSQLKDYQRVLCKKCDTEIGKTSTHCDNCSRKNRRKFEITKEELTRLVQKFPFTHIGGQYNVSANAVRKRCNTFGIIREHK